MSTIRPKKPKKRKASLRGLFFLVLLMLLFLFWLKDKEPSVLRPEPPYTAERYSDGKVSSEKGFDTFAEAKAYAETGETGAVRRTYDEHFIWMNGKGVAIARGTTLSIHQDAALKKRITYVASGTRLTVDRVSEASTLIRIAGAKGYVNTKSLELYPIERTRTRSYYVREGERLVHHIVADSGLGGVITAGKAPASLKEGEKSFDHVKSPSLLLDLRKASRLSASALDRFIEEQAPDSPLVGKGKAFKKAERKHGVNAAYLLAHAIHESNYGRSDIAREKFNLFGVNATDTSPKDDATEYSSFEDSIDKTAAFIKRDYLDREGKYHRGPYLGDKSRGMNVFYASDPYWSEKIAGIMLKMDAV